MIDGEIRPMGAVPKVTCKSGLAQGLCVLGQDSHQGFSTYHPWAVENMEASFKFTRSNRSNIEASMIFFSLGTHGLLC